MRRLACFLFVLVGALQAQPTVREAYTRARLGGGEVSSTARLRSYIEVVVCKADYDALTQKPTADFFLYLDGMKSTPGAQPVVLEDFRKEEDKKKAAEDCVNANAELRDDQSKAAEAAKAAETARKAATKDASGDVTVKDAQDKADAARKKADEAKAAAGSTYVLAYYLDPQLLTNDATKASWLQLLQSPWRSGDVAVSVGPAAGAWPSMARIAFERLNLAWLAGWAVLFIVSVVMFVKYARSSDIIRDIGTLPPGTPVGTQKAYSLARSQMALWTFLVAGALMFIFLVTWNENTLTNGVLVLIGISSGTTLLASVAEGPPAPQPTRGFFNDLLTDGTGPSFHRYQMLLFTVILAVIFVVKVINGLVMPEFDPTLLGLMGISNGTYLGFKLQGK